MVFGQVRRAGQYCVALRVREKETYATDVKSAFNRRSGDQETRRLGEKIDLILIRFRGPFGESYCGLPAPLRIDGAAVADSLAHCAPIEVSTKTHQDQKIDLLISCSPDLLFS